MSSSTSIRLRPFHYQRTQSCPLPRIQSSNSPYGSKPWLEDAVCWDRRAQLEQEFTTNFKCCGVQLQDLHSLLDHFETAHQPPLSAVLDLEYSLPCPGSSGDVDLSAADPESNLHTKSLEQDASSAAVEGENGPEFSPLLDSDMSALPYRPLSPPASPGSLEPLDLVIMPSQFAKGTPSRNSVRRPPTPVSDHDQLSDFEHDHDAEGHDLCFLRGLSAKNSSKDASSLAMTAQPASGSAGAKVVSSLPSLPLGVRPIFPSRIPSVSSSNGGDTSDKGKLVLPSLSKADVLSAAPRASTKTACPVVGCAKKYSSASGLRYHLQHAHDGVAYTIRSKRRNFEPY